MIDLSASADPEIALTARVLAGIDAAARAADLDYLVVGATARTILSIGLIGRPPARSTRDVDIAMAEVCTNSSSTAWKSMWCPYGGIEREDRTILWPDDFRMNVRGLSEAVRTAETVLLPGGTAIRVPAVPALDRLYEELEALEANEYDPALAGAWLLGSQIPALLDGDGREVLLRIAEDRDALGRLAADAQAVRAPQPMLALGAGIREAAGR